MTQIPKQESQTVEFKKTWSDTAKKTLIAFANGVGGVLYFGVDDAGNVTGITNKDAIARSVYDFARQGVEPPLADSLNVENMTIDGKTVVSVHVASGEGKPYAFKGKRWDAGGIFVRVGTSSVAAKHEEIVSLVRASDPRPWETRPSILQELSFSQASKIFSDHHLSWTENHYLGLGLINGERRFTNLAYLLSDQNPTVVKISFYDTLDNRFSRGVVVRGSILSQMIELRYALDKVNTPVINKQTGRQERENIFPYPPLSLREALTNCLAHRDYDFTMDSTINVYNDRIVFLTIGGLPPEISLEEALMDGFNFCRNSRLADIFHRLEWMENFGTGFRDIFSGYAHSAFQPICENNNRIFKICLPRLDREASLDVRILALLAQGDAMSRQMIEEKLKSPRSTVSKALKQLMDAGKIRKQGNGRSTSYTRIPVS